MQIDLIQATPPEGMTIEAALEWTRMTITQNPTAVVEFVLNSVKFRLDRNSRRDQALAQYEAIINSADNLVTG